MQYLDIKTLKAIFFFFPLMVIGSFKATAGPPSTLLNDGAILLTSDSIMLIGFVLWIVYIVFYIPKKTLKKM